MKVKYFALMRNYTKIKDEYVTGSETVEILLKNLSHKYGSKFHHKVFDGDKLSEEVFILVNGRNIKHLDELNTKLEENDEICIFPVVAGG